MEGKRYQPMGQIALIKKLKFPSSLHSICKEIIGSFILEGKIIVQKNRLMLPEKEKLFTSGQIKMHPRGFGFVSPDEAHDRNEDIFIPKPYTLGAVDQDRVKVEITTKPGNTKGPEGRVIEIIDRGRKTLVGIMIEVDSISSRKKPIKGQAFVPLLGPSKGVMVEQLPENIRVGDRVLLKVLKWEDANAPTTSELVEKLASIEEAKADIPIATLEYGIRKEFPAKVLEEAKKFGNRVQKKDMAGRVDLTDQACLTIDPKTAKDFDDALYVEKTKNGFELFVHIADVAHYVKEGSCLDNEAQLRANSTYFPGTCLPMLPEELSNNLCSLKEKVIRLTATVHMSFDSSGELLNYKIFRSFIKSKKRLTYEDAFKILNREKRSPFTSALDSMKELCLLLKELRRKRGSVDLALPELQLEINEEGFPTGYHIVEYDISHQIVEEFMLKANEMVATHQREKSKGSLFRIHESPTEENLEEFYALAKLYGFQLSPAPTPEEITKLFEEAKESPFLKQLSVAFIKSMKLAYYSPNNVGHYGLSLENYCHFTSPIRRYSDLIVQRILFNDKQTIELKDVAQNTSEKERISFRAETSVLNMKKLRFFHLLLKDRGLIRFKAQITKVKPFGLFFDIDPFMIEGFIHISRIGRDFFEFNPLTSTLIGDHSHETFVSGQKIDVELLSVDLIHQLTEYRIYRKKKKRKK